MEETTSGEMVAFTALRDTKFNWLLALLCAYRNRIVAVHDDGQFRPGGDGPTSVALVQVYLGAPAPSLRLYSRGKRVNLRRVHRHAPRVCAELAFVSRRSHEESTVPHRPVSGRASPLPRYDAAVFMRAQVRCTPSQSRRPGAVQAARVPRPAAGVHRYVAAQAASRPFGDG